MSHYLAWLVPAGLAIGLAIYALRSRRPRTLDEEASFARLVGLLILVLVCMFLFLWLVLDALSETTQHEFTLPGIVSLLLVAGFAAVRLIRRTHVMTPPRPARARRARSLLAASDGAIDERLPCITNGRRQMHVRPRVDQKSAVHESGEVGGRTVGQECLVGEDPLPAIGHRARRAGRRPVDVSRQDDRAQGVGGGEP